MQRWPRLDDSAVWPKVQTLKTSLSWPTDFAGLHLEPREQADCKGPKWPPCSPRMASWDTCRPASCSWRDVRCCSPFITGGTKGPSFCCMVKIYMVLILWHHNLLSRALSSKDAVGTSATCWPKIKSLQSHAEVSILENFYNISGTLPVRQRLAASTLQQRWQIQVQKVKSLPQFVLSL
ncbi:uncharacterized protein ACBT44_003042 isoform 4-T6 [Syngnathus typhle]